MSARIVNAHIKVINLSSTYIFSTMAYYRPLKSFSEKGGFASRIGEIMGNNVPKADTNKDTTHFFLDGYVGPLLQQ